MRLAWFTPWPPQRSGVAGRSAELVPLLAARGHAIDVFVDAARVKTAVQPDDAPREGGVRVLTAHDFLWRHRKYPYDLPVFQVGNSHLHKFIWPYLFRYPGLAVLHDARLQHARAEALIQQKRTRDYRAEFAWSHPEVPAAAAGFASLGVDGVFFYQWPMLRGVVESARLVAAHSRGVATAIARQWPNRPVEHIALGEGPETFDIATARRQFRAAHGLAAEAVVFGLHGGLTAEKWVRQIIVAFAAARADLPHARLLLVGGADPWLDIDPLIAQQGLKDVVCRVPSAGDRAFDESIAACDVTLNLRWPTALETSGPWVRSLALGRATVIIDTEHQGHVPALDPRTWRLHAPAADLAADADTRAVTVALGLGHVEQDLALALRRLGTDAALRGALGRQARLWWEREHTMARMVLDYERALARARTEPLPDTSGWPAHLRPDAAAHARSLVTGAEWRDPQIAARLAGFAS